MPGSAPWVVSDELWELVEPLLPVRQRRARYPGRKRLPDRQALSGILFVLHTATAWMHLPQELGFGSGYTCWRRLDEWEDGVCRCHALDATGVTVPATRTAPLVTHANKTLKLSVAVFPDLAEILESERPLEAAGRRNP